MCLGVPLLIIVLGGIGALLLAGAFFFLGLPWISLIVIIAFGIFYLWARMVTSYDDWRLLQIFQRLRIRPSKGNFVRFGGISYATYKLHKR